MDGFGDDVREAQEENAAEDGELDAELDEELDEESDGESDEESDEERTKSRNRRTKSCATRSRCFKPGRRISSESCSMSCVGGPV